MVKNANDIIELIIFVFDEKFENIKIIKFIFIKPLMLMQ